MYKVLYIIKYPDNRIRFPNPSKGEISMTQQIPAPENQRSERNVKTAMEDIALIKRIINHAEINLRRLGWLFLVYGSATLAFLVFENILTLYVAHTASLQSVAALSIIMTVLSYAVSIALFILFIRKRRNIRKPENVYTMKLFDLWGIMLFAPVALELILLLISLAAPSRNIVFGKTLISFMKYGAICICVFFTGHYISSHTMKVIAAALFILFPVLFLIPFPFFDGVEMNETTDVLRVYAYFNAKTGIISLLLPFVYIGLGIFSLKKQKGSIYGDE